MKNIIMKTVIGLSMLPLIVGCTKGFDVYNTNPYEPVDVPLGPLCTQMIEGLIHPQENDSQMIEQMLGSVYGGYFTMVTSWNKTNNFYTYNADDLWNQVTFNTIFTQTYPNYFTIKEKTNGKGHYWAMAELLRVANILKVTDTYGPIPYTKVEKGKFSVAYDSQETIYKAMFDELTDAIKILTEVVETDKTYKPLENDDNVYYGDYEKWIKFANSLKLRMAIRISGVAPELAQKMAEEAVSHSIGVMTSTSDDAYLDVAGIYTNPYYKASADWGEMRANASIVSFMKGYGDPRLSKYFTTTKINDVSDVYAVRSGILGVNPAPYSGYSMPNYDKDSKLLIMNAAEVTFLRAEGALKNWNMGGDAKSLYEEGVKLSFSEWAVKGVDDYLTSTGKPADFVDPNNSNYNITAKSTVTIPWAEDGKQLERIVTQKWIAMFPLGFEAWSDFRRTGYPAIFTAYKNMSTDGITSERQCRRLRFPLTEYQGNRANVQAAIGLLGGTDSGATDVWWAKKN